MNQLVHVCTEEPRTYRRRHKPVQLHESECHTDGWFDFPWDKKYNEEELFLPDYKFILSFNRYLWTPACARYPNCWWHSSTGSPYLTKERRWHEVWWGREGGSATHTGRQGRPTIGKELGRDLNCSQAGRTFQAEGTARAVYQPNMDHKWQNPHWVNSGTSGQYSPLLWHILYVQNTD